MRLRLAVVAVALLVSFGGQARDLGLTIPEYIGNIVHLMKARIVVNYCNSLEDVIGDHRGMSCVYTVDDDLRIVSFDDPRYNRIYVTAIHCIKQPCRLAEAARIFMKTSAQLSKYSDGFGYRQSWDELIEEAKSDELIFRKKEDVNVKIY